MHRMMLLAAGVALALVGGARADAADFAHDGWYLGLGGSYAFHWNPGNYDGWIGATTKTHNTGGLNTAVGYRVTSWFAAELEYEWLAGFDNEVMGSTIFEMGSHAITANGKFILPIFGRFQPYFTAGLGAQIYTTSDRAGLGAGLDKTSAGLGARIGAGLDTYITEHWLIYAEVDAAFSTTEIDNSIGSDLRKLFYIPMQFGVQYRF